MKIPPITQNIIRITAVIVLVEMAITFILKPYTEPFLHVVMLAVSATLIIYIWVIRPYVVAQDDLLDQIDQLSYHDLLTRLPNRHLLLEYTEKLMSSFVRHNYYGALLYIELEGFRIVNDHHGYDVGDAVLIEISKRLSSFVRAEDIVARVGGDKFVVVLDQISINDERANERALMVAERIRNVLSQVINTSNKAIHIGSDVGLCLMTPERRSVESVLKDAVTDMQRARRAKNGTD